MRKIESFEGIRAIACIAVFLCHFKGSFLPEYDGWMMYSPFRILLTGNTIVRVLFVLSGFVVCYKYFAGAEYEKIPYDIIKRWFRLAPVIIVSNLFVYIMMKAGWLYNAEAAMLSGSTDFLGIFNNFEPDLKNCLNEAFFSCYFLGANSYIGPLWTIVYEYLGCILVLSVLYLSKNNVYIKYIFYSVMFLGFNNYYNYFVLGMFICDIYFNSNLSKWLNNNGKINTLLFAISCYIVCMTNINDQIKSTRVLWSCAALVMFLTLINSNWGEKILGNKVARKVGKLSYAIYVIHWPIIESFSSKLYLLFEKLSYLNHETEVVLNMVLTLFVILGVANIVNKYIEPVGDYAIQFLNRNMNTNKE